MKDTAYDIVIIGAGVAGCSLAHKLARYDVSCAVFEAGNDIAFSTTRANSGIVHAGYDPVPGSLKGKYCAQGAGMFEALSAQLEFAYIKTGSLVLAFTPEEVETLHQLKANAASNNVTVELLDAASVRAKEPAVSSKVMAALYAPEAGICDPYGLAFACAEHAAENGVEFLFEHRVVALERKHDGFGITTADGLTYTSKIIINAAGVFADELNNLLSSHKISITPVRGEYLLYDTSYGSCFSHVMFQTPGALGKGTLITPTVHGNLLVGPNAVAQDDKFDVSTTAQGINDVLAHAQKTWPEVSKKGVITTFAGLRAKGATGDFIIGEAADVPGFYNIACFESPGLTAAPAVAEDMAQNIAEALGLSPKESYSSRRKRSGKKLFAQMSLKEREAAIAADPHQGTIVCRCCNVTKAEILYELDGVLPAQCMDALKWRTGATMGRCNGGFCSPEILGLFCEHTGLLPQQVNKRLPHSPLVVSSTPSYLNEDLALCAQNTSEHTLQDPALPLLFDVVIVGGGAAGMAAASAALEEGAASVALVEREDFLGGILRQCIHTGFGLTRFKKELSGPEYAGRETTALLGSTAAGQLSLLLNTSALAIEPPKNPHEPLTLVVSNAQGLKQLKTKTLILATGSRERGQGSLAMAGPRPAGVYSAGSAQNLINLRGCLPGKKVLIQGSGDIGLIMARRCMFQGAEVLGVLARSSKPSGLRRNVVQCLDDFGIPFCGNKLVTRLEGSARLEAAWVSSVDPVTKQVIEGSEERWECDTLLLSVGLIPENELALTADIQLDDASGEPLVDTWLQTNVPGIFACGNSLHIHDLADHASEEGARAGRAAVRLIQEGVAALQPQSAPGSSMASSCDPVKESFSPASAASQTPLAPSSSMTSSGDPSDESPLVASLPDTEAPSASTLPEEEPNLELTCVRCPKGCELKVFLNEDGSIKLVEGEGCRLGLDYATEEVVSPKRFVTATLAVANSWEPASVKTSKPVPKELIFDVLMQAQALTLNAPVLQDDVLIANVAQTGADLIATKTVSAPCSSFAPAHPPASASEMPS